MFFIMDSISHTSSWLCVCRIQAMVKEFSELSRHELSSPSISDSAPSTASPSGFQLELVKCNYVIILVQ